MLYHRQRKSLKNRRKSATGYFLGFLIVLILIGILYTTIPYWRSGALGLSRMGSEFRNSISSSVEISIASLFGSKGELVEENKKLEEKIQELQYQLTATEKIRRENEMLREFFNVPDAKELTILRVISRPPYVPRGMIVLDKGNLENIEERSLVLGNQGEAIGRISLVKNDLVKVILFSAPNNNVQAVTEGGGQITLTGEGGGNFYTEVPKGFPIEEGQNAYLSTGEEVAEVSLVKESKNDPFIKVYLQSPVNIFEINSIAVRTND